MPSNLTNELIEKFTRFRQDLYDCFDARQDTVMDLLDALAGNSSARSTVELSLSPLFRRDYSALYKAIAEAFRTDGEDSDNSSSDNSLDFGQKKAICVNITQMRWQFNLGQLVSPLKGKCYSSFNPSV